MTTDAERLDQLVASHGIAGAEVARPQRPLREDEWEGLLARSIAHRTVAQLAAATHDGSLPALPSQAEAARDAHTPAMRQAIVVERALVNTLDLLDPTGVEVRVLKGVAVSYLDHPDPSERSFNDVDLLLRPEAIDGAVAVLTAAGYERDLPERGPGWDRRFAKDITLVEPQGVEVDVHRTLVPGAFGFRIDLDELWADPEELTVGGRQVPALGPTRRAIHAVYSLTAAEAVPRLAAARDLVRICNRPDLDLTALTELAARWDAEGLLAEAVGFVVEQLGAATLPEALCAWAEQTPPTQWHDSVRSDYRSAGGTNTATLLGGVKGMSSWRDRAAYLKGLAAPTGEYKEARRKTPRPREWTEAMRELNRRHPRP